MSSAFVKEGDAQWLHDIPPTMAALIDYLTRENNGIRVYEVSAQHSEKLGKEVHKMSNGLDYAIDAAHRWEIIW